MGSKPTDDLGSLAAAASSSFPLLVYDSGDQPDNSQIMLSVADGSSSIYQLPEMRNCTCLVTPHGWVLTVDITSSLHTSLWNPQTGEKVVLPAMDKPLPEYCRCLLSDTVSSPDCLVLVYDLVQPDLLFCHVTGGTAWVSQSYDIGLYIPPMSDVAPTKDAISGMAAVHGKFFFLETRDVVGVLNFVRDPEPHFEMVTFDAPMPTFAPGELSVTMSYLLESSHELFLVCLFFLGCDLERVEEVGAYMMDFSKQEWCKVADIGDRAFLLGPANFAASCSAAEHGLKRGCVYFSNDFLRDSKDFHIFDLMEGTRELAGPTQDIPDLSLKPFWLVPVLP